MNEDERQIHEELIDKLKVLANSIDNLTAAVHRANEINIR